MLILIVVLLPNTAENKVSNSELLLENWKFIWIIALNYFVKF